MLPEQITSPKAISRVGPGDRNPFLREPRTENWEPRTVGLWSSSNAELTLLQLFLSFSSVRVHLGAPPPPTLRRLQQQVLLFPPPPLLCFFFSDPGWGRPAGLQGNTRCYSGKGDTRQMKQKCPDSVCDRHMSNHTWKRHLRHLRQACVTTLFFGSQPLWSTLVNKSITNSRRQSTPLLHCWKYLKGLVWTELQSASSPLKTQLGKAGVGVHYSKYSIKTMH